MTGGIGSVGATCIGSVGATSRGAWVGCITVYYVHTYACVRLYATTRIKRTDRERLTAAGLCGIRLPS